MDFLNKSLAQLSELFRSMTPGARITAGLLLAVVVVSLGYLFRQGTGGPDAFLFGGQALSDADLTRIEAALGEANISGVREGNRFRVSSSQQTAALAAIADADALPKNANTILENALSKSSPWDSSLATRERMKIAQQQTLTEIIRLMPWVQEAIVLFDEQPGQGLSRAKQVTGSVNVLPAMGEALDLRRQKALQNLVSHSIVGMKPDDVAVTNLGDGGNYGADSDLLFEMFDDDYYRTKIAFEMQQKARILNHLGDIPGVRVEVNAELNDTKEEMTHNVKPDPKTAARREVETTESSTQSTGKNGGQPGAFAQGPNRQGAAVAQQQNTNETKSGTTETENVVGIEENRTLKGGYTLKEVWATVAIPSSYLETLWKSRNPDATNPPTQQDLTSLESTVTNTVEDIVEPLLALQANKGQNTYKYVTVKVMPSLPMPTIEPPSTTSLAAAWAGRYWSTIAMLGVAMFSLLVLRSVVKGGPAGNGAAATAAAPALTLHAEDSPAHTAASEPSGEAPADDRPRLRLKKGKSLKDDLVEIVHEDPDAAAEILRAWIGKAS